jgi:hypothetical protein
VSIVALKPVNAGGAKGRRKVDVECLDEWKNNRRQCLRRRKPTGLNKPEKFETDGLGWNHLFGQTAC